MLKSPILFLAVVVANLLTGAPVFAAIDDVQACKTSDHYHDLDADYATCDRALKQQGLSKEDRAKLLVGRGEAAYFFGRMDLSIADLDEAITLNPNYGEAYLRRGWTRLHLNQFSGALQDFSNLLAMEPDNPDALFAIGFIYRGTSGWEGKTLPAFKRALEIDANSYLTRYNLALTYCCWNNRPDLAIAEYDRILRASDAELAKVKLWRTPGSKEFDFKGRVRFSRVASFVALGDYQSALGAINGIIVDYPDSAEAYSARAYLFASLNKNSESLADARMAAGLNPYGGDEKIQIAEALYRLKRYEEDIKTVDRYLDGPLSYESRGGMLFWRGMLYKQLHEPEQALVDLENSFSLSPRNLQSTLIQLIQYGYYDGNENDAYSEKARNGLQACLIDPACAS